VVVLNMSDSAKAITAPGGSITLATDRSLEGTAVEGALTVAPWTGLVIEQ